MRAVSVLASVFDRRRDQLRERRHPRLGVGCDRPVLVRQRDIIPKTLSTMSRANDDPDAERPRHPLRDPSGPS